MLSIFINCLILPQLKAHEKHNNSVLFTIISVYCLSKQIVSLDVCSVDTKIDAWTKKAKNKAHWYQDYVVNQSFVFDKRAIDYQYLKIKVNYGSSNNDSVISGVNESNDYDELKISLIDLINTGNGSLKLHFNKTECNFMFNESLIENTVPDCIISFHVQFPCHVQSIRANIYVYKRE